jgi:hypothetical protein
MSAALFDAPELEGQGALFGGPTMTADELRELVAADDQAGRIRERESVAAGRHVDVIAHRRDCGYCIPGHLCRDGKKLEKELRIALDVLRMMREGEL